jgi:2,3-bisphosphoglycerate-independent phosphoglycerate mutase
LIFKFIGLINLCIILSLMKYTDHILLVILDGWGLGKILKSDAIANANIPFFKSLIKNYPNSTLTTFGEDVGLPEGQMGNSEVGHMNLGAGRVVYQELERINKSIRENTLKENPQLQELLSYCKEKSKPLHIMGLLSDGGVHSHIEHLKALVKIAEEKSLGEVYIHAFTDGRDVDPKSGIDFIKDLSHFLEGKTPKISTVIGRYYAMDRDKRWERVKLAYDLLVNGKGELVDSAFEGLKKSYEDGITDEFVKPLVVKGAESKIKDGDGVLFFNFRTDRPREITEVLSQSEISEYQMKPLTDLHFVTMTRYDETYKNVKVIFTKDDLSMTLGEVLSKNGLSQMRIAETEKYPHVTFFFSGGREEPFPGENRIMIPSPKVATYDLKPEMSAHEITDAIIKNIQQVKPNFICLNYANTDMVGHTGVFEAAQKAAETVDECLQKLIYEAMAQGYESFIIADHGNSDYMINDDGSPNTAHTMNPVPCIYVARDTHEFKLSNGKLADLAPTILELLGIEKPELMDGNNLLSH